MVIKGYDDDESMINSSKEGMIYFSNATKLKSRITLLCATYGLLTRGHALAFTLSSQSTYLRIKAIKKSHMSSMDTTEVVSCMTMGSSTEHDQGPNDIKDSANNLFQFSAANRSLLK